MGNVFRKKITSPPPKDFDTLFSQRLRTGPTQRILKHRYSSKPAHSQHFTLSSSLCTWEFFSQSCNILKDSKLQMNVDEWQPPRSVKRFPCSSTRAQLLQRAPRASKGHFTCCTVRSIRLRNYHPEKNIDAFSKWSCPCCLNLILKFS